ncbi:AFR520Wp [Eremothecium gossypii ATCC 10895]|uniref:Enhancer of polycomb-like protein 1 n=1 Tax=Eremothecium gossypii (strain ATCC 10895 / CBS 109.51 / FGSC 9923 / NRRL Y-1056) TaxID=284811 RepID=EPL1_EREGS|nr:AFR520Wp [Eremothecium gossypii ATCC 10895]Q752Q3.2 RecName: Full=Enhancer of polycomb-like protein 1 [Eremothecium gossypii ATCC 10895]AAS53891.2 AFR520Wp [Eremothecium gossypii ATCC 10895]
MPTPSAQLDQGIISSNGGTSGVSASSTRFRHRKISVKQKLRVYKASDLKDLDQDELQQRELQEIETGVEKNEEREVHLHKILQKNQLQLQDLYIPTPDASRVWKEFDEMYQGRFTTPASYIQFSVQLEDCCGPAYNMDERDEAYLAELNGGESEALTEDEFELLMTNFESAIRERQPFLAMDPESLLMYEDLKPTMLKNDIGDAGLKTELAAELQLGDQPFVTKFDSPATLRTRNMVELIEKYGAEVYEYWKKRKVEVAGGSIIPSLKAERSTDKDDNDPYFCFRRREVRQTRKTRRVDTQNSQKLRLLYQQLQYTKELALLVAKREKMSMDMLLRDREIFQLRCDIKTVKRGLGIKGEDELLISQKRRKLVSNVITNKKYVSTQADAAALRRLRVAKVKDKKLLSKQLSSTDLKRQQSQLQKLDQQQRQQQQQQQPQINGAQCQQDGSGVSHVYVKLPTSKIPDIVLEDVDKVLSMKERNTKRFVEEKMKKRREEDGDIFFNLTDDPYNPVFEITIPQNISPTNAPFSSIVSSNFEISRSYYTPNLQNCITGNTNSVLAYNKEGEIVESQKYKKIEFYSPFEEKNDSHTREIPVRFRRRLGRYGVEYIDRKDVSRNPSDLLGEFMDFSLIAEQEQSSDAVNVYDSQLDELFRLHDKWKYDSDHNAYGIKFSDEPSRLNQISNETQVIRFGTMLGTKSYEQLREATLKYRQNVMAQRKKLVNAQRQQQQQQQEQQEQEHQQA